MLGNPPYNGFPGVADVDEERSLTDAYRSVNQPVSGPGLPKPQGQGLNDLYVRFFRMAERRIADKTGQGVVCFISNYSWLDGLSFPGMRQRYLDAFDIVRIDNLNGDKYRTGKLTPGGDSDPSIFSTPDDPVGSPGRNGNRHAGAQAVASDCRTGRLARTVGDKQAPGTRRIR